MKNLLFIAVAFSSLSAFANNPAVFGGRYEVKYGANCDRDPGTRAYVTQSRLRNGLSSLDIQFYSDEAVLEQIPTTSGYIQNSPSAGFSENSIVRWQGPNAFLAAVRTSGASDGHRVDYVDQYSVNLTGNTLRVVTWLNGREKNNCELVRK